MLRNVWHVKSNIYVSGVAFISYPYKAMAGWRRLLTKGASVGLCKNDKLTSTMYVTSASISYLI